MKGIVDHNGRAMLAIQIRSQPDAAPRLIDAWIDTGFSGELVVPRRVIDDLQLPTGGGVAARLADGSQKLLETFVAIIDWFGQQFAIEVIANDGATPLLGVGLLLGHRLCVDYRQMDLEIE